MQINKKMNSIVKPDAPLTPEVRGLMPADIINPEQDREVKEEKKTTSEDKTAQETFFEDELKKEGLSPDEALEILNQVITANNNEFIKDFRIGSIMSFSFRTLSVRDEGYIKRLLYSLGASLRTDPDYYQDRQLFYNLSAALVSFNGIKLASLDESLGSAEYINNYESKIRKVETLTKPQLKILGQKYWEFETQISLLTSKEGLEYFFGRG
jgi:hypothetical protein